MSSETKTLTAFPDSAWASWWRLHVTAVLAGIRADGDNLCRLPTSLFKACSGSVDRSGARGLVRLTVAGAAQV